MKNIFLDTNVIIDFLADRRPYSLDAASLFNYSVSQEIRIYVSAVSYNNIYYILRQSLSSSETIKLIRELSEMTEIIDVTKSVIKKSITSGFKDFEDAIQYHSPLTVNKMDFIVTRNAKDFKNSSLAVLSPREAVVLIENSLKK